MLTLSIAIENLIGWSPNAFHSSQDACSKTTLHITLMTLRFRENDFYNLFYLCVKVVYLTNSGSEANDLAMLMARLHTGNFDIITFRYCQANIGAMSFSH